MLCLCPLLLYLNASSLAQDNEPNLLENPGFEELAADGKPLAWTIVGKGAVIADENRAHSGKAFARVRFDDRAYQALDCEPGSYYVIEGWVRAENPETRELPRVKVYFLRPEGGRAFVTGGTMHKPGIGKWERFSIPVRSPVSAARISVALIGAYEGKDWFHFDDVALRRTPTRDWPDLADTPDLNNKTLVVPDLADVHSFALYRIPPSSLTPIDGLLSTGAWTGRDTNIRHRPPTCDFDARFGRPVEFNWVLIHALSPTQALGEARLFALPQNRHAEGIPITTACARQSSGAQPPSLVHSITFPAVTASGVRLRIPGADQRTVQVQEIQALGLRDGLTSAGQGETLGSGALPEDQSNLLEAVYPLPDDRGAIAAGLPGDDAVQVGPQRYLNVFTNGDDTARGVKLITLELAAESLGEDDALEVCLKLPAELDVNIRYAEQHDRGLMDRLKGMSRRNYADLFRVVTRLSTSPLRISFDIPDTVLAPGEGIWLTVRSEHGLRLQPKQSRVFVQTCSAADALPEHLPRVERVAVHAYSLASEAHAYDGRPYQDMILYRLVQRVLDYDPSNVPANHLLNRIARRWSPVEIARPGPQDAPNWAVWGRHAAREWKRIADWWIDNRWVENGELGGNLNDDVEYTCHWPLIYLITGDDRIRQALGAIADAVWEQSGETGYSIRATDVEHAAEDSSCSLPQMLLCEYGNPVHVERMMKMSEHIPFWTGINDKGRRHFRSYIFNTTMIRDEPKHDIDHLYCALAMCGATHLAWYCHNPQPSGWVREYAQAWSEVFMRAEKDKPVAALPCDVHFKTGETSPYTDSWRKSVYYSFGRYVMEYFLLGSARLFDDPAIQTAAEHLLGSDERVVEKAEEAMKRYANPPKADPDDPTSLDKTWRSPGDEVSIYRATLATGNKECLESLLVEIAKEFERNRWLLTEAEPFTDRVPVPATNILRYMFLGGDCAGKTHVPGLAVSWEGGGTDLAAFVVASARDSLKALLYSFADEPLEMAMRTWRLEHGSYEWTMGFDDNADDAPDGDLERRELELFRYARIPFTLPPNRAAVIEIRQLEKLEPLTARADLAISDRDIDRAARDTVQATVHNIGAAPAQNIAVRLLDEAGSIRAQATITKLDAPADLKPKLATVQLSANAEIGKTWRVVIDPANTIPEICEGNNSIAVADPRPRFIYLRS